MHNFFSELDKLSTVGAYYVAVSAFILALSTFLFTFFAIYTTLKIFKEQRITENEKRDEEIKSKKSEEAFKIFKIITGIKDVKSNDEVKVVMTAHLSAALVALRNHPEYRDALLVQKLYFDKRKDDAHIIWIRHQIDATIQYWNDSEPEKLKKHSKIDFLQILKKINVEEASS